MYKAQVPITAADNVLLLGAQKRDSGRRVKNSLFWIVAVYVVLLLLSQD